MISYENGNYMVQLLEDGTKIRSNGMDRLIPAFAESMDVKITDACDGGCPMCYEGCTPNGKHASLENLKWLDSLHPYTEVALNGNDMTNPLLVYILYKIKEAGAIANITVNQIHMMKYYDRIIELEKMGLVHGIGISLTNIYERGFIDRVRSFKNSVVHVIAGIITLEELDMLAENGIKVLILGYKYRGRGVKYKDEKHNYVDQNIALLRNHIASRIHNFNVICFDNLAIEQLDCRSVFDSDEEFAKFYMGNDGEYTFYIDCVDGKFARSSVSDDRYDMLDSVDEMFNAIRGEVNVR